MRTRNRVPADLAAILGAPQPGAEQRYRVGFLDTGGVLASLLEEIPGGRWLTVAGPGGERRVRLGAAEASAEIDAAFGLDDPAGAGRYLAFTLADAGGAPWDARAWIPDAGGWAVLDVEAADPDREGAFAPPPWMAGLAPSDPAGIGRALARGPALPLPDAGPDACADLRALLEPARQRQLGMAVLAALADVAPVDRVEAVRDAARDLGMALSHDKAGIRTSLMPFAEPGSAWPVPGASEWEAEVHRDLGCFVLRLAATGELLGPALADAAGLVLGPGDGPPALLDGAAAAALAAGEPAVIGGRPVRLWESRGPGAVEAVLVGVHPAALAPRRER